MCSSDLFAYGWQLPIARGIMGSKLEYTVAKNELNGGGDDDENYEFRGGAAARRRKGGKKKKGKDEMIKGNIESGNLWN